MTYETDSAEIILRLLNTVPELELSEWCWVLKQALERGSRVVQGAYGPWIWTLYTWRIRPEADRGEAMNEFRKVVPMFTRNPNPMGLTEAPIPQYCSGATGFDDERSWPFAYYMQYDRLPTGDGVGYGRYSLYSSRFGDGRGPFFGTTYGDGGPALFSDAAGVA